MTENYLFLVKMSIYFCCILPQQLTNTTVTQSLAKTEIGKYIWPTLGTFKPLYSFHLD